MRGRRTEKAGKETGSGRAEKAKKERIAKIRVEREEDIGARLRMISNPFPLSLSVSRVQQQLSTHTLASVVGDALDKTDRRVEAELHKKQQELATQQKPKGMSLS
jgi:hypothetical protein